MAESHEIVLATAGVVAVNDLLLGPLQPNGSWADFNWRLIPATAVVTVAFWGLDKSAQPLPAIAKGLAVVMLVTVLVAPLSHDKTPPLISIANILGYNTKNPSPGQNLGKQG